MKRLVFVACLLVWQISPAHSGIITGTATPFTGDPAQVAVTMDDLIAGAGKIRVSVSVDTSVAIGDLRGIFFHITDESLLTSGTFSFSDDTPVESIKSYAFGPANSVTSVGGNDNNLSGGGSPGPFDIGFEIGTQGIGGDDYQTVSFTLMHSTASLSLSLFENQSFGVRLTSVGVGSEREGSSKLGGVFGVPVVAPGPTPANGTVPEPATLAIWSILGICGLGAARRKRVSKA